MQQTHKTTTLLQLVTLLRRKQPVSQRLPTWPAPLRAPRSTNEDTRTWSQSRKAATSKLVKRSDCPSPPMGPQTKNSEGPNSCRLVPSYPNSLTADTARKGRLALPCARAIISHLHVAFPVLQNQASNSQPDPPRGQTQHDSSDPRLLLLALFVPPLLC